jgi:uncharacterized membrane protein (UPF0136 family)
MIVAAVFLIYGIILYVEAVFSYQGSGNRQPLIAGIVSGTILLAAAVLVGFQLQVQLGASIGVGAALAMLGNFGSRFMKSKKVMPDGVLLGISVVVLGILATQVFSRR